MSVEKVRSDIKNLCMDNPEFRADKIELRLWPLTSLLFCLASLAALPVSVVGKFIYWLSRGRYGSRISVLSKSLLTVAVAVPMAYLVGELNSQVAEEVEE